MSEKLTIRPSTKLIAAGYLAVVIVTGAVAYIVYGVEKTEFAPWHLLGLALFIWPVKRHIQTRLRTVTVNSDHLTFESGFLSKSRRTVDLAKVQDVTAQQSVGQRMLGTGNLMIETAGERSAMSIEGIDNPHGIADIILDRSRTAHQRRGAGY